MRGAPGQPVLRARAGVVLTGCLLLAGCGTGAVPAAAPADPAAASPGSTAAADDGDGSSPAPARPGQGSLADDPVFTEEFDEDTGAWPDASAFADGQYVLEPGATAAVPYELPASALGALTAVGVVMADGGATSLTCDLGDAGAVVLRLGADGSYTVTQQVGATATELAADTLDRGQRGEPGEPTALRLVCSDSPEGLAVAISLHGAGLTFVDGVQGDMPADGPTWSLEATGEVPSRLDVVLVTLVEA